jgi:hypothetical protein
MHVDTKKSGGGYITQVTVENPNNAVAFFIRYKTFEFRPEILNS